MGQPPPPPRSPAASTGPVATLITYPASSFSRHMYSPKVLIPDDDNEVYSQVPSVSLSLEGNHISHDNLKRRWTCREVKSSAEEREFEEPRKVETIGSCIESASGEHYNMSLSGDTPQTSPRVNPKTKNAIDGRRESRNLKLAKSSKSRISRERRAEKRSQDFKRQNCLRSIGKPLSQIALDVPRVPIPDATAFAMRPLDMRRQEAVSVGKIKRPLNAFMLYRRSYQNVAKTRCTRNNHQQVSAICGESWTTWEPQDVVNEFNRLAAVEKQMHEQAFPHYKYDPILAKRPGDDTNGIIPTVKGTSEQEFSGRQEQTKRNLRKRSEEYLNDLGKHLGDDYPHYTELIDGWVPSQDTLSFPRSWKPPITQSLPPRFALEYETYITYDPYLQMVNSNIENHSLTRGSSLALSGQNQDALDSRMPLGTSVDPSLLLGSSEAVYDRSIINAAKMPALADGWCNTLDSCHTIGVTPDTSGAGTFDAYLKGTGQDWEIELLGESSQFRDWLAQNEQADRYNMPCQDR